MSLTEIKPGFTGCANGIGASKNAKITTWKGRRALLMWLSLELAGGSYFPLSAIGKLKATRLRPQSGASWGLDRRRSARDNSLAGAPRWPGEDPESDVRINAENKT